MESYITVNNKAVHYYMWGERTKPILVFLHGLGSSGASITEVANSLKESYCIIAPDLPGHGKSEQYLEQNIFELKCLSAWLKKAMIELNITHYHLIGHSWGGFISLVHSKQYKGDVKSTVLLDGGYIRMSELPNTSLEEQIHLTKKYVREHKFNSWDEYEGSLSNNYSEVTIKSFLKTMHKVNNEISLIVSEQSAVAITEQLFNEPTESTLSNYCCNTILLMATVPKQVNDLRNKEANRLRRYTGAYITKVEGVSHDLHTENPKLISHLIDDWITKNSNTGMKNCT